jgi:DNA-binding response OmpR family regulator
MPRRVLITGQDNTLRARLQAQLAAAGYLTVLSEDAVSGLAMHAADPFDLVIHDLEQASLDGLEFLSTLRALPTRVRPAVFVLADVPVAEAMELATGLGVDSCLPKPVDVGMLLDLVDHTFRPERRAAASTWYVEDEPVDPDEGDADDGRLSEPEDPGSVTFH